MTYFTAAVGHSQVGPSMNKSSTEAMEQLSRAETIENFLIPPK